MIPLKESRKLALIGIYDSNGFQALVDVFDNIVTESENDAIGEHPTDTQRVLALHAIAYAQRAMLTKAINQIDTLVAEARQGEKRDTMQKRSVGLTEEMIDV